MKTYAIINPICDHLANGPAAGAAMFRDKLSRYYKHQAENFDALARCQTLVKMRNKYATEASLYRALSDQLLDIQVQNEPPTNITSGMFL
jgi:hypothetical protein